MLAVGIDDTRLRGRVGVDEIAVFIGIITRTFQVAVTQRRLDGFKCRYHTAIALEFSFAFFIGSSDGGFDFLHGFRIRLRDDQADAVLRRTAVDGFGLPDIGIRPARIDSRDYLARIDIVVRHTSFLLKFPYR